MSDHTIQFEITIPADTEHTLTIKYRDKRARIFPFSGFGDIIDIREMKPLVLQVRDFADYKVYGVTLTSPDQVSHWQREGDTCTYRFADGLPDNTQIVIGAIPENDATKQPRVFMSGRKKDGGGTKEIVGGGGGNVQLR